MEVILLKDVQKLGAAGQTVTVKEGYARNFLLPNGLALLATDSARRRNDSELAAQKRRLDTLKEKAQEHLKRLESLCCTIPVAVGDQGKLHGVITSSDILKLLEKEGFTLEKHQILLEKPIAQVGAFSVPVKFHPEVTGTLRLQVVQK